MSDAAARLRAVSFGTLDGSLWATAVDHPSAGVGDHPALVLGGSDADLGQRSELTWSDGEGEAWVLAGDGVSLTIAPVAPPVADADDGVGSAGAAGQQLCRVHGTLAVADGERSIDCVGTRAASMPAKTQPASARLVSAWFSDIEALTLLAIRPRGAKHQDADAVTCTLFDPDGWIAVSDPRLSTTYDDAGLPTRTSLELWIGEGEDEFPRRAAGEVSGPAGSTTGDGLVLRVAPLRCHSRGQDGAGVYVLATF